jgi:hypothetical protein|nr:MAG TPA: helix-turn-helix domain-containing protein [Caudoviricetes sp.]DAZ60365.1 MAG TPA: helix-turn-helix domain-containing protein [Caudoviricetes sp.]
MSKAVMISIRPRWCELIANGEKTTEIRKTRPKLETPFKCYIYCTKSELLTRSHYNNKIYVATSKDHQKALERHGNITLSGKVIGEFVCDGTVWLARVGFTRRGGEPEYRIANNGDWESPIDRLLEESRLTEEEINAYLGGNPGFGWHISDLKIYDKPRGLSEWTGLRFTRFGAEPVDIKRPPQSWNYVEEIRDEQ